MTWHHPGAKKPAPKRSAAKKPSAKKLPAKPAAKKPAGRKTAARPARKPAPRADLGAPVDGFFAKQPPALRPLVDELRALVEEAAPDAESSLKWGMPFYSVAGNTVCALGGHKAHVNLILSGPPGTFSDPDGLLQGEGKTGKHLKLRAGDELPRAAIRGWLRTAAERARGG